MMSYRLTFISSLLKRVLHFLLKLCNNSNNNDNVCGAVIKALH